MKEIILQLLCRDLLKLKEEINLYTNEADLWIVRHDIKNSAGSLALHLVGNLNHYIGATIGKTGYVRNRPFEFSGTAVPREDLVLKIEQTVDMLNEVLANITNERWEQDFELDFFGKRSTAFYVMHFSTHLSYHLGQINYHRRCLAGLAV